VYVPDVQPAENHGTGQDVRGLGGSGLDDADWAAVLEALGVRGGASRKIVLACHVNPDGDALGSMLATALGLRRLGLDVQASFSNPFRPARALEHLPGLDLLDPPELIPARPDVLMTFDTGSVDRLGDLRDRVAGAATVVVVDHHMTNTRFGTHHLIDPAAAATAVVVDELLARLGVGLDAAIAECLYVGLSTDTGSFRSAATTPAVHQLGARLVATGIDVDTITRRLYDARPARALLLLSDVLSRVTCEPDVAAGTGLTWTYVTLDDLATHDLQMEWVEGVVDMLRGAEETEVALVAKQLGPDEWAVSLRSRGRVDVGSLCVRLGGGGHRIAAGFTGFGPVRDVVAQVRKALDETVEAPAVAR
jgi:phosphoesterase RecJ-like protein